MDPVPSLGDAGHRPLSFSTWGAWFYAGVAAAVTIVTFGGGVTRWSGPTLATPRAVPGGHYTWGTALGLLTVAMVVALAWESRRHRRGADDRGPRVAVALSFFFTGTWFLLLATYTSFAVWNEPTAGPYGFVLWGVPGATYIAIAWTRVLVVIRGMH